MTDEHIDRLYKIIDALIRTFDSQREQIDDLQGALKATLAEKHCCPAPVPLAEPTGLSALFGKPTTQQGALYRHVCSKDKKHPVRSNTHANGQICHKCGSPMNSTLVVRRKQRG